MNLPEQTLPSAIAPATLLSPKANLFASRASRLRHLAEGHSLGPWLNWLAELCTAQQIALDSLPDLGIRLVGKIDPAQPVLLSHQATLQNAWLEVYRQLLAAPANFSGAMAEDDDSSRIDSTIEALCHRGSECLRVATGEQATVKRDVTDFLVAAAMQVAWAGAARQLTLPEVGSLGDLETCPCCGSTPVGGIVMSGEGKAGLRYLECSLCATRWNAVRARCTLCATGSVVSYLGIEGGNQAIQAETCDQCQGYIKTFFQDKDAQVDPMSDDLASLALDVLVGEQGYARGTPNLFLSEGEVD